MRRLTTSLPTVGLVSLAFCLTMCLTICLPAAAQELLGDIEPEKPEVRRYTVEMIVFLYAQEVSTGSEVFPRDEPEPEPESLPLEEELVFADPMPDQPEPEPEPLPDMEVVLLDESDFQLGEIMDRLERLDVYEPVMHFGWTQATWPEEQTEAIPLHLLGHPPAALNGELTLYLSRFLHLVVDLQLEAPESMASNVDARERLGNVRMVGELLNEVGVQPPVHYRIQENRILKNGELRYYDHPKFGVLAKVTRVEDEEEETGDVELLGYGTE